MPSIRALFISTLLLFCTVLSQADEMPKLQVQDGHKSEVLAMWVSDDGLRAVTVGEEGAVKIWDLVGEHVEKTLTDREGLKENDSIDRFTAAWAGESGAWVSSGSEIKYFDLEQGRVTRRFRNPHRGTEALEFDGEFLYQFADGVRKLTLEGKEVAAVDPVGSLKSASVQGGRIGMTGYDRGVSKLAVLDAKDLSPVLEMNDSYRDFTVGLSVDGSKVAYALKSVNQASCEYGVIDLGSKETLHKDTIAHDLRLLPYWTRDGRLFWEGHPDQGSSLSQFFLQQGHKITPAGPDRESHFGRVRVLAGGILLADDSGGVTLLDQDLKKTKKLSPSETSLTRVLLSPSNRILLTGGTHGALKVWDLSAGREGRRLEGFSNVVERLALSPGGSFVAAQGRDKAAVWSVDSGKLLTPILPKDRVMNMGFLDEQRLLVFTGRGELVVVNLPNNEETTRWEMGKQSPTCFAVSPKSDRVVAVIGQEIVEWSLTSKRDRLRKNVGVGGADQVLYSQDSSRIYFTTRGTIRSWDFMDPDAEFETFASIPRPCEALRADTDGVLALTEGGYLSRYSYSGELLSRLHLGNAYLFDLAENLALLTSGGSMTIVDTATAKRIGFLSEFNKGRGWVAVDSVGRFDGNEEGFKRLAFDLGNQTYPLSAFFNKYYQPGILKDILEVEVGTRSLPTLSAANVQKPPSVSISEPASGR